MDDMIELLEEILPDGWEVVDDCTLVCPHGNTIEYDGRCPEGCTSPLIDMGMI